MIDPLETLCEQLEDELERQETALALCRAQGEGLRNQDIVHLETKTKALELLLREAAQAHPQRSRLIERAAEHCGLSAASPTLGALIDVAPHPWRARLRHCRTRLQAVLRELADAVRANAGLLRASMKLVAQTMEAFADAATAGPRVYTPRGGGPASETLQPALIDQKG